MNRTANHTCIHTPTSTLRGWCAGSVPDSDDRGIESLTALVGDSVARVASGQGPDDEDKLVLRNALDALVGQAGMLEFITHRTAAAALPVMVMYGADALVDLIWVATEQLGDGFDGHHLLVPHTKDGLDVVITALREIEAGDRVSAQRFDPLFERVAVLAEEGLGELHPGPPGQA